VIGVLFFTLALALRGLLHTWAEKAGWIPITILSAAAAYGVYLFLPAGRGYPLLGVAVGAGCFVHLLGDFITRAGVPIMWPIPIGHYMWHMVGVPNRIAVKVGGRTESFLRGAFALVSIAAALALVAPTVLERFPPDLDHPLSDLRKSARPALWERSQGPGLGRWRGEVRRAG
jgi:membrane-bound metal-dependent hydrolase YbcI (DUF457 family)